MSSLRCTLIGQIVDLNKQITCTDDNMHLGKVACVAIDDGICRDLWHKTGVVTDTAKRFDARFQPQRDVLLVREWFLEFDDKNFRMPGVWLRADQLVA